MSHQSRPSSILHPPSSILHSARVLITGGQGQLGQALAGVYADAEAVAAPGHRDLDVTVWTAVRAQVSEFAPNLIIHTAAATNVDRCESEVEGTYRINALGARNLARAAGDRDIPLVYVSTNYVFDGRKPPGEAYHEWDETGPLSVYGHSKLAGEHETRHLARKHLIVRTSQVYAVAGRKFVHAMLEQARKGAQSVRVVNDQWGQPTFADDLAGGIAALASTSAWGTYHLTNAGSCSWAEWAAEIFRLTGQAMTIDEVPAATFPRPATPPTNGVLHNWAAAALGVTLPDWRDGLRRCLAELAAPQGNGTNPAR